MKLRAIGLALCAATLGMAQGPIDWRFAHPDADVRLSLNLQALIKSPAVTDALKKAEAGSTKDQAAQMQMVLGMLSSVDRIAISARQPATPPGAPKPPVPDTGPANPASTADALVLVTGSFDPKLVMAFFPSTGTSKVQQVGDHAILIGDGESFTKAVSRLSGAAGSAPADELAQSDLWVAGNMGLLASQASQTPNPALDMLKDLTAFSLGINFAASPDINLNLTATDPTTAGRLMGMLHGMMALAGAAPQAAALQQSMEFKQDGSRVKLHMTIPPELLQMAQNMASQSLNNPSAGGSPNPGTTGMMQQLQPLMGLLGFGGGSGPAKPRPAAAPAPAPKPNGDIIIYGLDDGPRVIKTN